MDYAMSIVVVGNKLDLSHLRDFEHSEVLQECQERTVDMTEVSSLTGEGIDQAIEILLEDVIKIIINTKGYIPYPENFELVDAKVEQKKRSSRWIQRKKSSANSSPKKQRRVQVQEGIPEQGEDQKEGKRCTLI